MYESNSRFKKFVYSYCQYHWCPIVFKVIKGLLISSNKYNSCKDGKATNNKTIAGNTVQMISINCPDKKYLFINKLNNNKFIKYPTNEIIIIKITIV